MASDAAGIADRSWLKSRRVGRIASEARVKILLQRAERLSAVREGVRQGFTRVSFELKLRGDKVMRGFGVLRSAVVGDWG